MHSLIPPGARLGPCIGPCNHPTCAQTRKIARSACLECGLPIGYERDFFARLNGFVHAEHETSTLYRFPDAPPPSSR